MQLKPIFLTLLLGILLVVSPQYTYADSTQSYLVTQPFEAPPPSVIGAGRVYFHTYVNVNYQSGRVFFSLNPDGTGIANISDGLQINFYKGMSIAHTFNYYPKCGSTEHLIPPLDITHYLQKGFNTIQVRLMDWCGQPKKVSSLYFVNKGIKEIGPQFLDLPWDYSTKGQSFSTAALSMTSYFDHKYPLLSTSLKEPYSDSSTIIRFDGKTTPQSYSSHDGYDYASPANLKMGDPVLAAAAGTASYVNTCGACGNMIVIDHGNGYQTRYMHLQKDGLITNDPSALIPVTDRQQIGKMGATGNVWPRGDAGAHIHFMVVQDKNNDGKFNDNIPDGVTDPFGWQTIDEDPWSTYNFSYGGQERIGNKSLYLWKNNISSVLKPITTVGGEITMDNIKVVFPMNSVKETYALESQQSPMPESESSPLQPISTVITTQIKDVFGNIISNLLNTASIQINFPTADLSQVDVNSLKVYSSQDGNTWEVEPAGIVNVDTKIATVSTRLLKRQYVLMAEKKDIIAPFTEAIINSATLSFSSKDNEQGSGVDYIMYQLNDKEWELYQGTAIELPENFTVRYYAGDKAGNVEAIKTLSITPTPTPSLVPTNIPSPLPTITIEPTITTTPIPSPTEMLSVTPDPTPTTFPTIGVTNYPTTMPTITNSPIPSISISPTPTKIKKPKKHPKPPIKKVESFIQKINDTVNQLLRNTR